MKNKEKIYHTKEELVKEILARCRTLEDSNIDEELIHELVCGKVSKDINNTHDERMSFGQRIADKIAEFGGSWAFIICFCITLAIWFVGNTFILGDNAFDKYPYVFLNLVLSCLAAIQAPVIMMSQNRQSEKDRLSASNSYLLNLKAEIIIEDLHKKLDTLIREQQKTKKNQELLLKIIEEFQVKK